ncbi:MAG: hypothetical protein EPN93_06775 [Spirochaetes bacterium]|nr:MAG: hypothetical protein EPN93_06775 [Spirochaetota bacterium]
MARVLSNILMYYFRHAYMREYLWSALGIAVVSLTVIAVFSITVVETYPVGWEKSFPVSPPGVIARNIKMASRGNFIAAVYEGSDGKANNIYITLSFNEGANFIPPRLISPVDQEVDHHPHVSISPSGHIAVMWQNIFKDDMNSRIFLSRSTDWGATWSSPERLVLHTEMEFLPQALYDDRGTLHVFYHGFRKNVFNLFHSVNTKDILFEEPEVLASSSVLRGAFFPAITTAGSYIFLVWQGKEERFQVLSDDLYFMKSGNYGSSWSSFTKITRSNANDASPSIMVYRDTVYCVYQNNDDRAWSIKMLRGRDYGENWDEPPVTVSLAKANCYSPVIFPPANDEIVVMWYDSREIKPGISARKYRIAERDFAPDEAVISQPGVSARKPVGVATSSRIIAMWEEDTRVIAKYSDVYVEPPVLYSRTHPEAVWTRNTEALIEWAPPADESGIKGYAVYVNALPDFIPPVSTIEGNARNFLVRDLDDGVTYFHIRAIDGANNYSRTVHYKLQVSRNQIPMPVVVSSTHPEAKVAPSRSPLFKWSIEDHDRVRLKGFLYSFASGEAKQPDTFTTSFEAAFSDLDDGRYFFTVEALDKLNTASRTASYEIIVNRAEKLDRAYYERLARGFEQKGQFVLPVFAPPEPGLGIEFPFDPAEPFGRNSFDALLAVKNIPEEDLAGFVVALDFEKRDPGERVSQKGNILNLKGLDDGTYVISARARYQVTRYGQKTFAWTAPVYARFEIRYRGERSPVLAAADDVLKRLERYRALVSITLVGMALSVAGLGFGTRISFFASHARYRIRNLIGAFMD